MNLNIRGQGPFWWVYPLPIILILASVGGGGYYNSCYTPTYYYPTQSYYRPYYTPVYYSYATLPTYSYYSAPTYQSQTYQSPTYQSKDWKTLVLELAKQRDKVEGEIRKQSVESQSFIAAMRAMGLEGNFHLPNYGHGGYSPSPYRDYNRNFNLGTYGSNGQTIYGYTLSSVKDLYGDNDMNSRFQEANRLAQNAQTLGGQAVQGFQQAVTSEGNNRSRVAEILAQGQIAAQAIQAARPYPQASSSTTITQQSTGSAITQGRLGGDGPRMPYANGNGNGSGSIQPQQSRDAPGEVSIIPFEQVAQRCIQCHGSNKQEGGFNILNYPAMSAKEKAERVWPRLTHPDKDKRMPKNGPALTPDEVVSIILAQKGSGQ